MTIIVLNYGVGEVDVYNNVNLPNPSDLSEHISKLGYKESEVEYMLVEHELVINYK